MDSPPSVERTQSTVISHPSSRAIWFEAFRRHSFANLAGVLLLVVGRTVFWTGGGDSAPLPAQILNQDTTDQHVYDGARTILDYSYPELLKEIPEIRRLQAAESQKELPAILGKVGANVEALLDGFPNLVSREDVTLARIRIDRLGSVQTRRLEPFSYMILAHENSATVSLEEYRTDARGNRTMLQQLERDFCLTKGFATLWTLFNPGNRSAANFRLLGQEELDGHMTDVVAFAQRPGWATVVGRVIANGTSVLILYQGIAWIDVPTYQIIRMRTDMLAPRWDLGLRKQTTDVNFGEVRLPEVAAPLWLPQTVVVTSNLNGETLRNEHRYTGYRLFRVESTIRPVEPGKTVPKN